MTELDEQVVRGIPANDMAVRRAQAIKRIKAKNDFKIHLVVYLAVNTMLVLMWAFTSTLRLRNIHDRIGGKKPKEEWIDAKASDGSHPERERARGIAPDH